MFGVKRIVQVSAVTVLVACLVGGALAKGGGGGGGGGQVVAAMAGAAVVAAAAAAACTPARRMAVGTAAAVITAAACRARWLVVVAATSAATTVACLARTLAAVVGLPPDRSPRDMAIRRGGATRDDHRPGLRTSHRTARIGMATACDKLRSAMLMGRSLAIRATIRTMRITIAS